MESLIGIYTRLVRDGWTGFGRTTFDRLDPFPKVSFHLVDGFDPLGNAVEDYAPWFELEASASATDYPGTPGTSTVTFHGEGPGFLSALGSLLDHINTKSWRNCVWSESEFSFKEAEAYIAEHPLFGMTIPLCARFQKQCYNHKADGYCEVHTVQISPWRRKAMVYDPFLSNIRTHSKEDLMQRLAYRIRLAYGGQETLPTGIDLYFAKWVIEKAEFFFDGDKVSFRASDDLFGAVAPHETGIFENHMLLLNEAAKLVQISKARWAE